MTINISRRVKDVITSSNGNIFRVTGPLCGEFTGPGEFPTQRPVTRSFDVFFDLRLNNRLSKQPWGWWFETPSWSLWLQCNDMCRRPTYNTVTTTPIFVQPYMTIIEIKDIGWIFMTYSVHFMVISSNSLTPRDAYICYQTRPSLVQIMAWRLDVGLFSIGPLRTCFGENLIKIKQFS